MSEETDTTGEVARVRPVTEFHVTHFGLSELEHDALLDLYADHAYKFAERHKHETPLVGSRSWPTEEAWEGEGPNGVQIAAPVPAGQPSAGSAGRGGSGGSCARCGAGITLPAGDPENREMAVCMPCELAVFKEGWKEARAQVEAIRGQIAYEARHGDAITRCNLVAERFQTVLDGVTAETGEEGA